MMQWHIEYSIVINAFLRKRFFKQLFIIAGIYHAFFAIMTMVQIQNNNMTSTSGYYYFLLISLSFFWLITLCMFLIYSIKYNAYYSITQKSISQTNKPSKERKKLRALLDFINTATYANQPGNFALSSISRRGKTTIHWKKVRSVRFIKKVHTVVIKGQHGQKMFVFYDPAHETNLQNTLTKIFPHTIIE